MDNRNIAEFIRALPSFPSLRMRTRLVDEGRSTAFLKGGEIVFNQGDRGRFYVVYSGKIRIIQKKSRALRSTSGSARVEITLGNSFNYRKSRNATARAAEESVLIVFPEILS